MADRYVDIDIDPRLRFLWNVRFEAQRRSALKNALERWKLYTEARIYEHAPVGDTGYIHRHIGSSALRYSPGAPGGGGSYEAVAGIRRGTSDHPLHVHFGTMVAEGRLPMSTISFAHMMGFMGMEAVGRIYPRHDRAVANVIETRVMRKTFARYNRIMNVPLEQRPSPIGNRPALTFQKKGEGRKFRAWVRGQAPNPYVYMSYRETMLYAKGDLKNIARALFPDATSINHVMKVDF